MQSSTLMFFACMAPNIVADMDYPKRTNVQSNFHDLFDSLARKNHTAVDENRNILNQELMQEKEAFDSIKIRLAPRRRNNAKKASWRHKRDNLNGNEDASKKLDGSPHPATPDSQTTEISSIQSATKYWRPRSTGKLREPAGESMTWIDIRRNKALYADKSVYLQSLLEIIPRNVLFYLTRPRRFGKTSFLSMVSYFFNGNESCFRGLEIHKKGNAIFLKGRYGELPDALKHRKWIQCPVIHLDLGDIIFSTIEEFKVFYFQMIQDIAQSYKLDDSLYRVPGFGISNLIFQLKFRFKMKVVVLIDEYDSPFQHALVQLKNATLAKEVKIFLNDLFRVIKCNVEKLRLVLVLGVSRLGMTSLEASGPNNYVDLTYEKKFAGAFGFTSEEIADFRPEIAHYFDLKSEEGVNQFLVQLRKEYDGYNFTFQYDDGEKKNVLNPVSTMKCIEKKKFGCYWSSTGSINTVIRRLYFSGETLEKYEHIKLPRREIERKRNPPSESINLELLLLMFGYLTIENYDEETEEVTLNFPTNEIKTALKENVDAYHPKGDDYILETIGLYQELKWHMETGRLVGAMRILEQLFNIRFSKLLESSANEYSITMQLAEKLNAAGISYLDSKKFWFEDSSINNTEKPKLGGDVDIQTRYLKKNFIISLKYGHSAVYAIRQLIGYLNDHRTAFLEIIFDPAEAWFVGINFDDRTGGTIHDWVGIPFKNGNLVFDQCVATFQSSCEKLKRENQS